MRLVYSLIALSTVSLCAAELAPLSPAASYTYEYGFSDYHFIDQDRPWHAEGRSRYVAPEKFESHRRGHINYCDADGAVYYTQFLDEENSLTYELGYDYLHLKWKNNPRFKQNCFNYIAGSIGYVSTTLTDGGGLPIWDFLSMEPAWILLNLLWGMRCCGEDTILQTAAESTSACWDGMELKTAMDGRSLVLIGVSMTAWSANAIFPLDYSLNYAFDENWSLKQLIRVWEGLTGIPGGLMME